MTINKKTKTVDRLVLGHIILSDREIKKGFIAITDEKIIGIGSQESNLLDANQIDDFGEDYIFPAAIDAQTHSRSQKDQEDFIWSTKAAASGGVGTIVDMPYDAGRLICNAERFNLKKQEASSQARVDFALYGTVHPKDGSQFIQEQIKAGAIGFKFSTFGTDPERFPRIPPYTMHDCFSEITKYGLIAGVHNEDDEVITALTKQCKEKNITNYQAHNLSRPIYSENLAITQVYELGADTGCRSHIVHCSNKRGFDICKSYQNQGFQTTIETCLHYLILNEDEDVKKLGGKGKVNPPIRGKCEQEGLWHHLATGGVTAVSTDHVSWSLARKEKENIFDNASGASGLQLLLPLLVDETIKRNISLCRVAQVLAYNPARLFSLQGKKGALELGCDADLAIIKKDPYTYYAKDDLNSFSDWSPYDGKTIDYQVTNTMLRGKWIYSDKNVLADPGFGEFISPTHLN